MPADIEAAPVAPAAAPAGSSGPPAGQLSASAAVPPPVESTPPKPGSARERMFADLRKKAKPANDAVDPDAKPVEPPAKPAADEDAPVVPADKPAEATAGEKSKTKVSPWKLVEEYKAKVSALERQVADSKTTGLAEQEKKSYEERAARAEARAKELDDEIRFVNYSKSDEYKSKFEQPYLDSWSKAMAELSEITVRDSDQGIERPATAEDLLNLVNLPLGKARELANVTFGDFADDAMAHRKEIRALFDAKNKALEEAKKSGAERDKQRAESYRNFMAQAGSKVKEHWDKTNQEIFNDPKYGQYFKPVEGDVDGNQRLAKGYALVDRAFSENPMAPNLSAEERSAIVKRHAAVRNRAAAFGRLVYQNQKLSSELAEARKVIDQYKGSEPGAGDRKAASADGTVHVSSAREAVFAGLRKYAKQQ